MEKIKRINYNQKHTVPVENNPKILNYLVEKATKNYELNKKPLQSDLRKEFKNKLGHHDNIFTGEYTHYIWYVEYDGLKFKIFSAKGGGTVYEFCDFSYDDIRIGDETLMKRIIAFLDEIDNLINN